jgi:hypothetical protein
MPEHFASAVQSGEIAAIDVPSTIAIVSDVPFYWTLVHNRDRIHVRSVMHRLRIVPVTLVAVSLIGASLSGLAQSLRTTSLDCSSDIRSIAQHA